MTKRTPEHEGSADAELLEYAREGDRGLRNLLITRYGALVARLAKRLIATMPPYVEYGDLVSSGTLGLFEALDRFDPDRGFPFEAFAVARVRGAMLDHVRALDGLPRRVGTRSAEAGSAAGWQRVPVALDELATDPSAAPTHPRSSDPVFAAEESETRAALRWAMDRLPDRSRSVITWYYLDGLTFTSIGRRLGVTASRAAQLHARALGMLRARLRAP